MFDALTDTYLAVVLAHKTLRAITVLTAEQYESKYGAIPPIALQLARLARVQDMSILKPKPSPASLLNPSEEMAWRWGAKWRCILLLKPNAYRKRTKLMPLLPVPWRQQCLLEAFAARGGRPVTEVTEEDANAVAELPFSRQVALLAESPTFLAWVVEHIERRFEKVAQLSSIQLTTGIPTYTRVDATNWVAKQLSR